VRRSIKPSWLLRQADELAYRGQGAGQPRNINLRRAVSSAYYALFHALVLATTNRLLPSGTDEERRRLARSFDHRSIRQVCDWILGGGSQPKEAAPLVATVSANASLQDVALAFRTLQNARYDADYNHLADFTKAGALTLIDQSRDAVDKLRGAAGTADLERLLALITLRPSLR